ncbi:MAG: chemotaxis protein CheB [Luteolibacter sp.]
MSGESVPSAVVIGVSAGAFDALSTILPELPAGFPCAVLVVVHLPPDRKSLMASLFASRCALEVKEAEDKEMLRAATIYFAPPDYHLLVEPDFSLSLSSDEPVLYSRPSIDVLFESAADAYGDDLVAVVLTGANHDGARGLRTVCDAGGRALVQSPDSAEEPTMPRAALAACPEALSLPLAEIAVALKNLSR